MISKYKCPICGKMYLCYDEEHCWYIDGTYEFVCSFDCMCITQEENIRKVFGD